MSVNYVFFLAAESLRLFKPSPSFRSLSPNWYRAPIFTFLTFIIVKGKQQQQQQKTKKMKIKNKQTKIKKQKTSA